MAKLTEEQGRYLMAAYAAVGDDLRVDHIENNIARARWRPREQRKGSAGSARRCGPHNLRG